ncbi:phosphatidate cytidylyltransferase [Clostridium cellulovorans]|uniref:Phosphatidate cytidylyltransferase n=1 Tax=Clostridium cellulovorans (strain ATCC 35296 / DSM 3052 / OCM 3 / 743B) TaxID=573061 RepID=D9SKM7_CLOC7|nr:phosphatidate cytidylyltransferase [Clostridium cellulovorans]ADL51523.1 phosphatidate cytidylyltransferase [Clostridium cellulovorans 743B]
MNKRYLGALILTPLVIFISVGGDLLRYGLLLLSFMGIYELYSVASKKGIKPIKFVGYFATIAYYIFLKNVDFAVVAFLIFLSMMLLLSITAVNSRYNFNDIFTTIGGFIYVPVFFSFIYLTNVKEYGEYLIWIIFFSSWVSDTCAYFVGVNFGKHKIIPKISPNKTVEGSLGGLLGGGISCFLFGLFAKSNGVQVELYHYIIIGLLCSIFSQLGDLTASSIKRHVGVKDYSNLIPGHGGILDRFDSILFSSVIVFYYVSFIIGL